MTGSIGSGANAKSVPITGLVLVCGIVTAFSPIKSAHNSGGGSSRSPG